MSWCSCLGSATAPMPATTAALHSIDGSSSCTPASALGKLQSFSLYIKQQSRCFNVGGRCGRLVCRGNEKHGCTQLQWQSWKAVCKHLQGFTCSHLTIKAEQYAVHSHATGKALQSVIQTGDTFVHNTGWAFLTLERCLKLNIACTLS